MVHQSDGPQKGDHIGTTDGTVAKVGKDTIHEIDILARRDIPTRGIVVITTVTVEVMIAGVIMTSPKQDIIRVNSSCYWCSKNCSI